MARGWGSEQRSPEERGPVEARLRWKADTDRVRERISEGFRVSEPNGSLREAQERLSPSFAQTSRNEVLPAPVLRQPFLVPLRSLLVRCNCEAESQRVQ